ncbi:MAG: nucleoside kinase [Roseburia sp.]|nr:nucleoside kinase [Roseburia sp.]
MAEKDVRLIISGEEKVYPAGTTYLQIAKEYQKDDADDIILVLINNRLRELGKVADTDGELAFVTTADKTGRRTYRRSVILLMQKAIYNLWGDKNIDVRVKYSIGQGYYCELVEKTDMAEKAVVYLEDAVSQIKAEMDRLVAADITLTKESWKTEKAVQLFKEQAMYDKARLFRYRRSSRVNIYNLDGYRDYFYGYMAPSTGYLKYYDIRREAEGFMLMFPGTNTKEVAAYEPRPKLFNTLKSSRDWGKMLDIDSIGALNDMIAAGNTQSMILTQEALFEERIGNLAQQIVETGGRKFIMIAGPSSSGKTTFSHRLSIQLQAKGLKPHPIPLDNYYKNRSECPKDEFGNYDLECLESIDVELFNHDMQELLAGKKVELPTFNFKTGRREYKGKFMQLHEDDVLVIEGIHGLNPKLSYSLPDESKFKIYISALTQLNIDEHNCLPTTDARLIRRIVRDARTRGTSAIETIRMWDSVRRGEEKYIFPFQEGADVMFNSALIYELAVLKIYAEPLLFAIDKNEPGYLEAKRLLKFLDYFLPMPADGISQNSVLREFIGGSCFNV